MKVAFLSPSLSRIAGGIFEIERELALALHRLPGVSVAAYGVRDRESEADLPAWAPLPVRLGALRGPHGFGWSPELRRIFLPVDADVTHLHALWMYTSVLAMEWARRHRRPFVTTVNGMLEPWARDNARLKKRLAALAYERRALKAAACLHVNTEAEMASARAFGVEGPFCIIPNGVTLPGETDETALPATIAEVRRSGGRVLLHLGRLHPKKNIAAAVTAFATITAAHPDWHYVIAGWGSEDYLAQLKDQVRTLGLERRVHFAGPVFGAAKAATLATCDAFLLASHSEGFPMAVLEAMAHGKPVAMTATCNLGVAFDAGAALEVGTEPASIATGLRTLFEMAEAERTAIGARGRALVEDRFTWDRIARQMHAVYAWLTGGGAPPETVVG